MAKKKRAKKKSKKKVVRKKTAKRKVTKKKSAKRMNPTRLAKSLLSKVASPGARFSRTQLKSALSKAGLRNVKGWFDEMIRDAIKRRLLSPINKSVLVYTPAAANPTACAMKRKRK